MCVCVCVCVFWERQKWEGLGPKGLLTAAKKIYLVRNIQFPGRHSKEALQKHNSIFSLCDPTRNTETLMTFLNTLLTSRSNF